MRFAVISYVTSTTHLPAEHGLGTELARDFEHEAARLLLSRTKEKSVEGAAHAQVRRILRAGGAALVDVDEIAAMSRGFRAALMA